MNKIKAKPFKMAIHPKVYEDLKKISIDKRVPISVLMGKVLETFVDNYKESNQ
mgnify:CR=1 FL=1|tara:strand:+ start:600 stop:758 length:159 start_codon:yes stop_codon:yes gene_type:complete